MSKDSSKSGNGGVAVSNQYASIKWGPGRGILATIAAFAGGQLAALVIVVAVAAALGAQADIEDWVSSTQGQFIFILLAEAGTLFVLWFLLHKHANLAAIGFTRNPKWNDLGKALLTGLVYLLAVLLVSGLASSLLGVDTDQKQEIGFENVSGNLDKLLIFVSLVILPPITEEILFRGVLFGSFRKRFSFKWAALITSLLFAVPHLLEGSGSLLWIGGIDTFVLSLFLCHLRERTGSLWASIMLHMLKNGVAFLALFVFISK